MACRQRSRTIYSDSAISVEDFRCRALSREPCRPEVSDGYYVVFVRRGGFERLLGSRSVLANTATVVFFNPGEEYRVAHPFGSGDECTAIRIEADELHGMLDACEIDAGSAWRLPSTAAVLTADRAHYMHWRMLRSLEHDGHDAAEVREQALALTLSLVTDTLQRAEWRRRDRSATRDAHRRLTGQVERLLTERFREPLCIDQVSREVSSSRYHLCRVFRRETGLSIHEYLTRLRLREALRCVADGERDLLSLALRLGFCHHGHMGRVFKRQFGLAPSTARGELHRLLPPRSARN